MAESGQLHSLTNSATSYPTLEENQEDFQVEDTEEYPSSDVDFKSQILSIGQLKVNNKKIEKVLVFQNDGKVYAASLCQKIKSLQNSALSNQIAQHTNFLIENKGKYLKPAINQELNDSNNAIELLQQNDDSQSIDYSSKNLVDRSSLNGQKFVSISFNNEDVSAPTPDEDEQARMQGLIQEMVKQKKMYQSHQQNNEQKINMLIDNPKVLNHGSGEIAKHKFKPKFKRLQSFEQKPQLAPLEAIEEEKQNENIPLIQIQLSEGESIGSSFSDDKSPYFQNKSANFQNNSVSFEKPMFDVKLKDGSEIISKVEEMNQPQTFKTEYLSLKVLNHNNNAVFSNLSLHGCGCKDPEIIEKFANVSEKPKTLIFEPIGTLFALIDKQKEQEIQLTDPDIKIIQVFDETLQIYQAIIIKVDRQSLFENIKKFKPFFELILYTFLPQAFLTRIFEIMPELYHVFDHVLTKEDANVVKDFIVRDISIFIDDQRTCESLCVVDCNNKSCDADSVFSLTIQPYEGGQHQNLIKLQEFIM